MCAGFPQGKPGKQDAKRIATFAYHLLRRRKRLIKKTKSGISSGSSAFSFFLSICKIIKAKFMSKQAKRRLLYAYEPMRSYGRRYNKQTNAISKTKMMQIYYLTFKIMLLIIFFQVYFFISHSSAFFRLIPS